MRRIDPLTRYEISPDGCWLWTGPKQASGHGRHGAKQAHRLIYELLVGQVENSLVMDHLCRNRSCVNPAHLEPVTQLENVRRGVGGAVNAARQRARTHCKRGHEFTPENTGRDSDGNRYCRECSRQLHRSYYHADLLKSRGQALAHYYARHEQNKERMRQRARRERLITQ